MRNGVSNIDILENWFLKPDMDDGFDFDDALNHLDTRPLKEFYELKARLEKLEEFHAAMTIDPSVEFLYCGDYGEEIDEDDIVSRNEPET